MIYGFLYFVLTSKSIKSGLSQLIVRKVCLKNQLISALAHILLISNILAAKIILKTKII